MATLHTVPKSPIVMRTFLLGNCLTAPKAFRFLNSLGNLWWNMAYFEICLTMYYIWAFADAFLTQNLLLCRRLSRCKRRARWRWSLSLRRCRWWHNSPRAPSGGGLWIPEAMCISINDEKIIYHQKQNTAITLCIQYMLTCTYFNQIITENSIGWCNVSCEYHNKKNSKKVFLES